MGQSCWKKNISNYNYFHHPLLFSLSTFYIRLYSPPSSLQGNYNHLVYQYGSGTGFVNARSAVVRVWQRSTTNSGTPTCVYTLPVTAAAQQNTCYGRFWNTFQLQVTQTYPLKYTLNMIQSVTATPQASLGSTVAQLFEGPNDRPSSGCR